MPLLANLVTYEVVTRDHVIHSKYCFYMMLVDCLELTVKP